MARSNPRSVVAIAGHPLHPMLVSFPIVCFTLTLLTDIAYWRTSNLMWQHFSEWLLFAGLIIGGLAALAGVIDVIASKRIRSLKLVWFHALGNVVVLGLALVNSLVHAGDGWTAVVPWGLTLSAVTVAIMLVTGWLGASMIYKHRVGVSHHE
ncbi:DUF2231 domain-containing protein [Sulfitobacter aestuarii]|uniref:DUF2231 domain-containing protein n=1 Tax=Sulfitobacter aestuarii TaxID=2161676 RepID=A0ABW5U4Y2_9RHOB